MGEKQIVAKSDAGSAPATGQNALASVLGGMTPAKYADDKAFGAVASGGDWLPRLQLFGGNSDAAKEGKIPMGHYGVVTSKDTIIPVGPEVDCLVLSWRPKAMSLNGDDILTNYNPQSAIFQDIVARSELPDSGCMFGPEFLLYLPGVKRYVTFMMGSKSSRREAPNLKTILEGQRAATLKVALLAGKKFKWHNPVATRCSTPFELPTDIEALKKVVEAFNNPKESDVEPLTKSEGRAR